MNIKKNQQYQTTDLAIQSYLLELIKEKTLNSITVSEICKHLGINRSSFYLHYQDVYDLMDKIIVKYLGQIHEELTNVAEKTDDYTLALVLVARHIKDNQDFYIAYFNYIVPAQLEKTFKEMIYKIFLPELNAVGVYSDYKIEYHFVFVMNGILAMFRCWLANKCKEPPEEIVKLVMQTMSASSDYIRLKNQKESTL